MKKIVSQIIHDHLLQFAHPVVNCKTFKVEFYEILSRINYKNEIESPKDFMSEITPHQRFAMAKCILEKMQDYQLAHPTFSFSINISSIELNEGLWSYLRELSTYANFDTSKCILEVAESINTPNSAIKEMIALKKECGYQFALDDFGAGFSNFEQIYRSNGLYDFIKIDGSMVTGIDKDEAKKETLGAFILAIQKNEKKSIVEFVENQEILDIVIALGADYVQGYVFGKPAPLESIVKPTCESF
ncbi:MAG: EAL domain-containing protein [Erysipelotrichia bacterium]|nr:EAL domain-containing protein [Erysipelotrichia bacterium]